jgi:transposase InsO family protein
MLIQEYPITLACEALGCARSSYYYRPQAEQDAALRTQIEALATTWPTYGSRRIQAELRRQGYSVSRKRARRLMRQMGLQVRIKRKRQHTTNSDHPFPRYPNLVEGLEIIRPDQVWVADITYVHLLTECVYLAVLMDVFTRAIRGWYLGRNLDQELTLTALRRALKNHRPETHHSDQGVQYAATAYVETLDAHQIAISMAEVGAAWQNGYAERLIRTIKEEAVDLTEYRDYQDAYDQIGHFLEDVYMRKRIHSSLGYLTPVEFEQRWVSSTSPGVVS